MSGTSRATYRPHPDVLFAELGESQAVLLSLPTAVYFALNETGRDIWCALENGATRMDIVRALHERYEVEPDEALRYADAFLAELLREGLVLDAQAGESTRSMAPDPAPRVSSAGSGDG